MPSTIDVILNHAVILTLRNIISFRETAILKPVRRGGQFYLVFHGLTNCQLKKTSYSVYEKVEFAN